MTCATYARTNVHMADIDVNFTQFCTHASDHAWFVKIAAEEDVTLWYELCPVAPNAHNTRFVTHYRTAKCIYMLVA